MSCLAGIAGCVWPLMRVAERAPRILIIDGCPLNCARHALREAGFSHIEHLQLNDLGFRKGQCPVTAERIAAGARAAAKLLEENSIAAASPAT